MIKKIVFKNYKAFKEEQMLELRPVTLLIGKNSSGKTSLCNLVHMLSQALSTPKDEDLTILENVDPFVMGGGNLFHKGDYTSMAIKGYNEQNMFFHVDYIHSNGQTYLAAFDTQEGNVITVDEEIRTRIYNSLRGAIKYTGMDTRQFAFTVNHIGPIRDFKSSLMKDMGYNPTEVDRKGRMAYDMLINSYEQDTSLYRNVAAWFRDNLEGQEIHISPISMVDSRYYFISVAPFNIGIEHVGEGFRQVLPVIVETYNENASDVTIIEQPALHLHPAAHAAIMHRIAESAKQLNRQYVIESHSENMLLELRRMVSDPQSNLNPEDVIIYYVDMIEGVSFLKPIYISAEGELSFWPTGVFGEGFEILSKIMKNRS